MGYDFDDKENVNESQMDNLTDSTINENEADNPIENTANEILKEKAMDNIENEALGENNVEDDAKGTLEGNITDNTFNNSIEADVEEKSSYSISENVPKNKSNIKTYIALILASSVITGSLVGGGLYYMFTNQLKSQTAAIEKLSSLSTTTDTTKNTVNNISTLNTTTGSTVSQIAKKVSPSIVGIRMTVGSSRQSFYNGGTAQSEGSGVIISKDGYIMTNYHVVQYADPNASTSSNTTIEVFLSDKTQAKAKFIGGDSETDLAVIKVELNNLTAAELGDSSTLQVGELAVAIGNPLGIDFAGSVTTGVISATNRLVQTDTSNQNYIQTDAAINPGNSGGALLNSKGQVIGINSAKISETGVEGLGFAIPINDAKPIINQLVMFGYVKGRPFIGISGQDISETISSAYNIPVGVYVKSVSEGSGAEKAGIKPGDIITNIGGKSITSMQDINTLKKQHKAGDTVSLTIVRNGSRQSLKLTFTEEK